MEFTALAVLLLVPLVYLIIVVARVQAASFAVTLAAREAARAFVSADDGAAPLGRAEAAARLAFHDHKFADAGTIRVLCAASPCLTPESEVTVRADVTVDLPLVPSMLAGVVPTRVPLSSTHVVVVDRFRAK